ncbi:MAG: hypothetical protein H7Y60_13370 [Rhodospirillaceae bacterium]|nr:hypothetical protein [Rhodospirillales bacterium]
MRDLSRLVLALALVGAVTLGLNWPAGAWAQAVKFKRCLNTAELQVEQLVRHGVYMREAARRCTEYKPGTDNKWKDFDQKFGVRLKQQTDRRAKLFAREFKDNALKVRTYFDGRLVTYHRNFPISIHYCENIDDNLDEVLKRGWGGFTQQAKVLENEVLQDYKACAN